MIRAPHLCAAARILALAAVFSPMALPAVADHEEIWLFHNHPERILSEFYIRPSNVDAWGPNLLRRNLRGGARGTVDFPHFPQRHYDHDCNFVVLWRYYPTASDLGRYDRVREYAQGVRYCEGTGIALYFE